MPAGCCSPPQQWLHFSSIYACKALGDPSGRRKTKAILNIFLYFRSTKDIHWKHILYRHHNRRNFQTLPYTDCSLLWDDFLPQITEVQFATHTSIANHCVSRHFPQQLRVPWIRACKVPPASCIASLSQPLWNLLGGSGYLVRVGRRCGKGLSCIPITPNSWIVPTITYTFFPMLNESERGSRVFLRQTGP